MATNRIGFLAIIAGFCLVIGCGPPKSIQTADSPQISAILPTRKDLNAPYADRKPGETAEHAIPEKVVAAHLPNPWRIHSKVISGGLPEGDAAFKELADLGVKTVISVDGAKPDVALAKKHGLRYVHMPHGYDGVPEHRAKELAKAVRDLPGPIYIHCHHGKHRSPAAATVACVGAGLLSSDNAVRVLKAAGTSESYRGLYQSAGSAKRLDDALLDQLKVEYPESVRAPPIVDVMIAIEHAHEHLKSLFANQWQELEKQPDLDAAHEGLLLCEHYTELLRTEEVKNQPEEFRTLLSDGEATAKRLESLLDNWKKAGYPSPPPEEIGKTFASVTQSCAACHKAFRDVPLSERQRQ